MTTISIKAGESRQLVLTDSGDYIIKLTGSGSNVEVLVAKWAKGSEHFHLNITTIHQAPHTTADTFIRAIADGQSQVEINGTIIVEPKAQDTNSFLTENILLLSSKAQAHAIPNLEIEANDVKCSHAATIGRIDLEQLFYLRSRGLANIQAKRLIAQGFLSPVYSRQTA